MLALLARVPRPLLVVLAAALLTLAPARAQNLVAPETLPQGVILVVEDKAKLAGAPSPIYLASNLNGWNPGEAKFRLQGRSDMRWQIELPGPMPVERLEFKFTRGSWDLEELDANLGKIANRTLPKIDASKLKPGEKPIIELAVERWGDETEEYKAKKAVSPFRELKVTGTVRRLQVVGGGALPGGGGLMRDALVWLPPGYDDPASAATRYPVLYLHDGQNVFEQPPGVPGEWRADETATTLIAQGKIRPLIIVAIPHAGDARLREYLPVPHRDTPPGGDDFADWLVTQVKPRVDRAFRTLTGPANTAVGGASMGAVIAMHASARHPGVFGGLLLESLPLQLGGEQAWTSYLAGVREWPTRVMIGVGARELGPAPERAARNAAYVDAAKALVARLQTRSSGAPTRVELVVGPEDEHNEQAWARRLPAALEFLFPAAK